MSTIFGLGADNNIPEMVQEAQTAEKIRNCYHGCPKILVKGDDFRWGCENNRSAVINKVYDKNGADPCPHYTPK